MLFYMPLVDGIINDSFTYTENSSYSPFTIRVWFEWYEGNNENMNDEADTEIGKDAAINGSELQIQASIQFEQSI